SLSGKGTGGHRSAASDCPSVNDAERTGRADGRVRGPAGSPRSGGLVEAGRALKLFAQLFSINSILYPSGSRTKQSREPPSRTEYGGFSGSIPCCLRLSRVASRSSAVIAMWP